MSQDSERFTAYVDCAIWASVGEDGKSLDDYEISDLAAEARASMAGDLDDFFESERADLELSGLSDEQAAHDFWLTRNGHGTGFWDRGLGEIGERLSRAAKVYGTSDLWVGDDGKLYVT